MIRFVATIIVLALLGGCVGPSQDNVSWRALQWKMRHQPHHGR